MTSTMNPQSRTATLDALAAAELDVLVVGGGVVGAGAALDAVSRGLTVGLVEARDWAAGTSSRSSKLVHGGLRYLEMFDFALVREALKERGLLLQKLAPHLVRPVGFLYPLTHRVWERAYVTAGVTLYDTMGVSSGNARGLPHHRQLTKKAIAEIAPALRPGPGVSADELAKRFGEHQHALIEAARAEARLRQWRAFTRAVEREADGPTRALLTLVRDVFALTTIERDLGWYLVRRRLSVSRAKSVTRLLDTLLTRMRPHALQLVQAFGYTEEHLRAAIASGAEGRRQSEARAAG